VGFVGWNPFQFIHFAPVIAHIPGAEMVIEKKHGIWKSLDPRVLGIPASRVHHLGARQMRELDGQFDVLVCQTPFTGIENLRESRLAMLQYGYAKEAHNFGAWRSFADVCMTYGPYASRKIEPFAPCVATGNPRYEDWKNESFHLAALRMYSAQLDPSKKTILYAPTWGGLSSFEHYSDAVGALSNDYNIVLKIHHNTQRLAKNSLDPVRRKFGVIHSAEDDIVELLSIADVLITDCSGAIFDAIYCNKPVILLDLPAAEIAAGSISDSHSLEQARRGELGTRVGCPGALRETLRRVLEMETSGPPQPSGLRDELFIDATGATRRASKVIVDLAAGCFSPSQTQQYIRNEMAALYSCRADFRMTRIARDFLMSRFERIRGCFQG
jgi:hypothetical protein